MVINGQQYSDEQLRDLIKYDRDLIRKLQADVDRFNYILELRRMHAQKREVPTAPGARRWPD